MCFQGDRFGGALDAAARLFSHGVDSGLAPMEFVNDMRKKGQLIMGIGHRVKSVSNLQTVYLAPRKAFTAGKNTACIFLARRRYFPSAAEGARRVESITTRSEIEVSLDSFY